MTYPCLLLRGHGCRAAPVPLKASLVATEAIITAGSNPQGHYAFQSDPSTGVYPSELRVEY